MDETTAARLQQILAVAAIAPGNQERFLTAGVFTLQADTGLLQLAPDWQSAFTHIPILLKETVRTDPGQFLATADDIVYRGSTSGSSGNHFIYFADTNWNTTRLTTRSQAWQWWGIDDTVAIVNVASRLSPLRPQDTTLLGAFNATLLQQLLAQLSRPPVAIRGYPSRLCELATHLIGQPIPPIVAIICTGECLFEFQQQLLEQVFLAPVINEYGCQESGISGLTCPEIGRLHLDQTRCWYEVVDGRLITTDLWNTVMPMVRYDCGDRVQLDPTPCPCGRSHLTATILGRQEDWVRTAHGVQHPGAVAMPAFEGILQYQVMQATEGLTIRVHPDNREHPLSFEDMAAWVEATFGSVPVQVLLETATVESAEPVGECKPETWIQGISRGNWVQWFQPVVLPTGELRPAAQLLAAIVAPTLIGNESHLVEVDRRLQTVLHQPITRSLESEQITLRILCLACSRLSSRADIEQIYQQMRDRLHQLLNRSPDLASSAILDTLITTLCFPVDFARSIWLEWLKVLPHPGVLRPDTFTIQHLLHAFEPAVQRANAHRTSVALPTLSPLLAVLMGDLETLGDRVSLAWIAHWFELLTGEAPAELPVEPATDEFTRLWWGWRQQMIRRSIQREQALANLRQVARSPQQQARVLLEQGYEHLLAGKSLDPDAWLAQLDSIFATHAMTPTAWAPVLRAFTKTLINQQHHTLAYECLLASTVPSSQAATFERLSHPGNRKQAVLLDLDA